MVVSLGYLRPLSELWFEFHCSISPVKYTAVIADMQDPATRMLNVPGEQFNPKGNTSIFIVQDQNA